MILCFLPGFSYSSDDDCLLEFSLLMQIIFWLSQLHYVPCFRMHLDADIVGACLFLSEFEAAQRSLEGHLELY